MQVCIFIAIWYATMPDIKTHVLMTAYMYNTPNGGFTANDALFYKNKLGQLHYTLQFQLIVYAVIKITRRGTTVPLYEFATKHPKKNINQR